MPCHACSGDRKQLPSHLREAAGRLGGVAPPLVLVNLLSTPRGIGRAFLGQRQNQGGNPEKRWAINTHFQVLHGKVTRSDSEEL